MLDLKRRDRPAVYFDAEFRGDGMPATWARWKKRYSIRGQPIDIQAIKQRLPFHISSRAVENDDAAAIVAAFERVQLMQEILHRAQICGSRNAEISQAVVHETEFSNQHMRDKLRDVQVVSLHLGDRRKPEIRDHSIELIPLEIEVTKRPVAESLLVWWRT